MLPATSHVRASVGSPDPAPAQPALIAAGRGQTYGQILRSSALIGGSSALNILASIVRIKTVALLLGPAGVGIVGLYTSVFEVTQSIAGMGINNSGVRHIAEAVGSGDTDRIAKTAVVLGRTSMVLGILGALLLILLCRPISRWTFGTDEFAVQVAMLSLAVFFQLISLGQVALIQGMRRIADLARVSMLAAFCGTGISLTLIYFFRERGIVPALVASSAVTLVISWWHRRKIYMPVAALTVSETRQQAGALLSFGSAFMVTAVLTTGAAYVIRTLVAHRMGLEAAGLYHAAWALGGLYVGLILQAMASDFYPRLTAVAKDDAECNRLVNEQAQMSVLLAGPGVIATLTFAPFVVRVFYDGTFAAAVEPLRWICLGMALRVVAWPMGFIILAKGERNILLWVEVAAAIVHVALAFVLVGPFRLAGATMAFLGLYIWHGFLVYAIVRRLTGFRWSPANRRTGVVLLPLIGFVFVCFLVLPVWIGTAVGTFAILWSGHYSLREICKLISLRHAPRFLRDALVWCRISPPETITQVEAGCEL